MVSNICPECNDIYLIEVAGLTNPTFRYCPNTFKAYELDNKPVRALVPGHIVYFCPAGNAVDRDEAGCLKFENGGLVLVPSDKPFRFNAIGR